MDIKITNGRSGASLYDKDDLHVLLITLMALMPYLPYVLSAAILVIVSASILIINRTRAVLLQHKRMYTIVLAITAVSLLGSVLSKNYIGIAITFGVFVVLTFATYARTAMTKALYKRVQTVTAFGGIFTAVVVVIQKIAIFAPDDRPTGLAFNANYLGAIATFTALISIMAFYEARNGEEHKKFVLRRILFACSVIANLITLLICESRSSLLGLMAGVFVFFLLKKHYILCSLFLIGGVGVWVLGYFKPQLFGWTNSLTFIFNQRVGIWLSALDLFASSPKRILVGMGPMSYYHGWQNGMLAEKWFDPHWLYDVGLLKTLDDPAVVQKTVSDITTAIHAHNIVADTLVNVGILGAICYLALARSFLRHGNKRRKAGDKSGFVTVFAACATVLVAGIPDVTIMWHQSAMLFVLMCSAVYRDVEIK